MLNNITVMGRLVRDVELRRTQTGVAVCSFTIAVDRDGSKEGEMKVTDFIDCVAWRQTAEFVSRYFSKGSMAVVNGRLEIRTWQDREGNNRKTAEINVSNVYFGEKKSSYAVDPAVTDKEEPTAFTDVPEDNDDLPF